MKWRSRTGLVKPMLSHVDQARTCCMSPVVKASTPSISFGEKNDIDGTAATPLPPPPSFFPLVFLLVPRKA